MCTRLDFLFTFLSSLRSYHGFWQEKRSARSRVLCFLGAPGTPALAGGSAASLVQGPLQGTCADTGRFPETNMEEAKKKAVPARSLPAQLALTLHDLFCLFFYWSLYENLKLREGQVSFEVRRGFEEV